MNFICFLVKTCGPIILSIASKRRPAWALHAAAREALGHEAVGAVPARAVRPVKAPAAGDVNVPGVAGDTCWVSNRL